MRVENTITNENSRSILPIIPETNDKGRKTTTSTKVMATAVKPISERPSSAALRLSLPISRWRVMFSSTTIESSTRIPITSESAISVSRFNEKSKMYMPINTDTMDVGMETSTMSELRKLCRNTNITSATMMMASIKSTITALAEARVYSELSEPMLNFNPWVAYCPSSFASSSFTLSHTSTALASLCF